jgi:alpha,alpha-trehalase
MNMPTPRQLYGRLFVDVQVAQVLGDGKSFVDARPRQLEPAAIVALYEQESTKPWFSLHEFVLRHFEVPQHAVPAGPRLGIREHIRSLWPLLLREAKSHAAGDSLLPLPHPYVVPGGRFRELYYWDSYFTMLGLVQDGCQPLAEDMLRNFSHLIEQLGFVPNSSRSYMLTRSQPPFFFRMVQGVHGGDPADAFARHLPQLRAEHAFWMDGSTQLAPGQAHRHAVMLPGGTVLNRYWDDSDEPREESYREDVLTARAGQSATRSQAQICRDLRAGAESGWDFSSRWCADPDRIDTIETTSILPVDLNALLWGLESAIAEGSARQGHADDAARFRQLAHTRQQAMTRLMWSTELGHFVDWHWVNAQARHQVTAAALVPLYVGLATPAQADATARVASGGLLARNGLMTTLRNTGQQWDAPNGWAPLQWMAAQGLERYGHGVLARELARRWCAAVHRVYLESGRLLEKYDVMEDRPGGGGEYETQDGFGWTNGTFVAFREGLARL